MSTIASLSKRVIALQEEYASLLRTHEPIKLDLSVLPQEEQLACSAFLASIEDRMNWASVYPLGQLTNDELKLLKKWALRLKELTAGVEI